MRKKFFLSSTKMDYGRPDIMYLLNDIEKKTNKKVFLKYSDFLREKFVMKTVVVEWDECISNLSKKLKNESFDLSIGIGEFGKIVTKDLMRKGIKMGDKEIVNIKRLSNYKWEKIGYVHSPNCLSIKSQIKRILKKISKKEYKKIVIVDDVTYSGGTRKIFSEIKKDNKDFFAIDLITLNSVKNKKNIYKNWFSGITVKEDPYPTLNSSRQADVMNVSEFIFPSKLIGKIINGQIDKNNILWEGDYRVIKEYPYTSNSKRNEVYFGEKSLSVYNKTHNLQKIYQE